MPDTNRPIGPLSTALLREIAELRRLHGVRQEDIAEAIGRTQPYVSARVNGQYPWTSVDLDRMAHLFGMDAWGLVASSRRWASSPPPQHTDPQRLPVAAIEELPDALTLTRHDDEDDDLHEDRPGEGGLPLPD